LSPPTWIISAFLSPHPAFLARRDHRLGGFTVVVDHQQRQIAEMPGAVGPFMFTGLLRIVMSACRAGGDGFTLFNRRLAAAVGMNMKAVLAGR
jgi:hypothetical protein